MTAPDPLIARRNQIPRGIFYMVLSTVMFAGVNAIVKWEVALYPVGEVAFFRSAFAFFAVCGLILPRTGLAVLRTNRYREHLQRGLSQFGSMMCIFMAFRLLSLGSAIAISFSAPLFTTLLSIRDPEGKGRGAPLVGADRRVYRGARRDPPRRRDTDNGRLFRARQCGLDLQRRGRDP